MIQNERLRCDTCGKFVSIWELEYGNAHRTLVTPDSDYSSEYVETLCGKCYTEITNALGADMEIY